MPRTSFFRIRSKLSNTILSWMLASTVLVLGIMGWLTYLEVLDAVEGKENEIHSQIEVLTPDFIQLSVLEEMEDAVRLQKKLLRLPNLKKLELFRADGQTLFYYENQNPPQEDNIFFQLLPKESIINAPVSKDDENLAKLSAVFSNQDLIAHVNSLFILALMLMFGLAAMFYLLRQIFQNKIAAPINALSDAFIEFRQTYEAPSTLKTNETNEIGHLYRSFNDMAKELCELKTSLEKQVEKRTLALKVAKNRAEEAEQARSNFLANMSHELRTPINGILGFAELLKKADTHQERDRFIETIRTSSRHLLSIVNDILDFSKIEKGEIELHIAPEQTFIDLDKMLMTFIPTAHQKDIIYEIVLSTDLPECLHYDSLRLHQVLNNLVSNAMKFTPQGGTVKVIVEPKLSEQGKPMSLDQVADIAFTIQDSGIGIPESKHNLIFENFKQSDNSTSKQFGGTGLGLSIANQLVQKMGGDRIHLKSAPNKGSCFCFTLPLKVGQAPLTIAELFHRLTLGIYKNPDVDSHYLTDYLTALNVSFDCDAQAHCHKDSAEGECMYDAILVLSPLPDSRIAKGLDASTLFVFFVPPPKALESLPNVVYLNEFELNNSSLYNVLIHKLVEDPSFKETSHEPLGYTHKILLAEDNFVNQSLMQEIFKNLNLTADIAQNGEEAVKLYQTNTYGLVLMDINMPIMDGCDALLAIQKWAKEHQVPLCPIIALTANVMQDQLKKFEQLGFDAHLAKPLELDKFVELLNAYAAAPTANEPIELAKAPKVQEEQSTQLTTPTAQLDREPNRSEKMSPASDGTREKLEFNLIQAANQLQLGEEVYEPLFRKALQQIKDKHHELTLALESSDYEGIYQISHSLYGACASLQIQPLADTLHMIEKLAHLKSPIELIKADLEKLYQELEQLEHTVG